MVRKILLILIISFATTSTAIMALGLGEIKLKSGLNQPLNAEITLLSVRGESNDQLKGKLGSMIDFERSGIDRTYFLTRVKFKTITKSNGERVLQLTTKDAVKEPFLNFLVDLEWPNGRLLREYTLLLDPPIFDDAPKTVVTPVAQQAVEPKRQYPTSPTRTVAPKPEWEGELYGPTSGSDTLWGIAAKVRPSGVSMQQAMITIYETNPNAFMRGNINYLKRGAEIRVPESDVFTQITQREALRMIAAHNENWKTGKTTKSKVVMDTSSSENANSNSQKTADEAESGRLQLGTDSDETGTGGSAISDNLSDEENEVLKQENEFLSEQTKADADKIAKLERLLELKDEQLANIQNRDNLERDNLETTDTNTTVANSDQATTVKPELKDLTPKAAPVEQSVSILDGIMAGTYNLYLGIVGVIVFLLLVASIFRRKSTEVGYYDAVDATRSKSKVEPISIISESDVLPEIADDVLAGTDVTDIEQENIDTEELSDPLGEADIYLAYGKFEQAESILLSAIEKDQERLELNVKLLECYSEMKQQVKFEDHVTLIVNEIDSDTELKTFIEELYLSSWPEGNLFGSESYEDDIVDDEVIEDEIVEDVIHDIDINKNDYIIDDINDDSSTLEDLPSTEDVFGDADDSVVAEESDLSSDFGEEIEIDEFNEETEQELDDDSEDVNTQLDLARAYVEMGDFEGTREIIKEILETGSEKQCEEAQSILDSIDG